MANRSSTANPDEVATPGTASNPVSRAASRRRYRARPVPKPGLRRDSAGPRETRKNCNASGSSGHSIDHNKGSSRIESSTKTPSVLVSSPTTTSKDKDGTPQAGKSDDITRTHEQRGKMKTKTAKSGLAQDAPNAPRKGTPGKSSVQRKSKAPANARLSNVKPKDNGTVPPTPKNCIGRPPVINKNRDLTTTGKRKRSPGSSSEETSEGACQGQPVKKKHC